MRVKLIKPVVVGPDPVEVGDVIDVKDDVGTFLVRRGMAVAVTETEPETEPEQKPSEVKREPRRARRS